MIHVLKATKLDVLRFIWEREAIEAMDLVNEFGYTYDSARVRLNRLERARLVEKLGIRPGAYCLTNEAIWRLEYHEHKE